MGNSTDQDLAEGRLFSIAFTTPSIAAAGNYLLGITTGARPVEFLDRYYTASPANVTIELFELAYTGGASVPALNRNMGAGGASPATFVSAPTATISGTPVATVRLLAGSSAAASQIGLTSDSERYILKNSKQYVLRITNNDASAGFVALRYTFKNNDIAIAR